jgi:hypothetical protein
LVARPLYEPQKLVAADRHLPSWSGLLLITDFIGNAVAFDPHRTLVRLDKKVDCGVQRTSRGSLHSFQVCRPKLT